MKIVIEYCGACGYERRAALLASTIREEIDGAEVSLLEGSGGVFEVIKDGTTVFSKKALGRFPSDSFEVIELL